MTFTRTGGTMIAFTTMAIFKIPQGITTKMLLDKVDEGMSYTYMHYNSKARSLLLMEKYLFDLGQRARLNGTSLARVTGIFNCEWKVG